MNRDEVIDSINELAVLIREFSTDRGELLHLAARMRNRLDQLDAHNVAGRPDLAARLRTGSLT